MWFKPQIFAIAFSSLVIFQNVEARECESMTLRSFGHIMEELPNCTAVLGNLVISLIYGYDYDEKLHGNLSFPLREVTGFFMYAHVEEVKSLGKLFPNLTIIRGNRLFSNYAVSIYGTGLTEISLRNLLRISRGSFRIGGFNAELCVPTKIDWERIFVNGNFHVAHNSSKGDCDPKNYNRCDSCFEADRCWNNEACQRFDWVYQSSQLRPKKCHPLCLGDCKDKDETSKGCFTCRNLTENFECVEKCSANKLLDAEINRCIEKEDCIRRGKLIFKDNCVETCPTDYSNAYMTSDYKFNYTNFCEKCVTKCPRICKGITIYRWQHLEELGIGCTIINGTLEINFNQDVGNISEELQMYFSSVTDIWGSLKIYRSSPLTELTFLNNLRIVEGTNDSGSAIEIYENQNLQTLFDWEARMSLKLKVKKGSIHIFNNFLLCGNETRKFLEALDVADRVKKNVVDVIQNNGARNRCFSMTLWSSFSVISHDTVTIRWKPENLPGHYHYKSYLIQFIPINSIELLVQQRLFERDSCSSYGWETEIVKIGQWKVRMPQGILEYNLTGLVQSTIYGFSVQTSEAGSDADEAVFADADGAISPVKSFKTNLKQLSRVKNLRLINKTSQSLTIQWKTLDNEASSIQYFYIDVVRVVVNVTEIDKRNYCNTMNEDYEELEPETEEEIIPRSSCCDMCCDKKAAIITNDEDDFSESIESIIDDRPIRAAERQVPNRSGPNFVKRFKAKHADRELTIDNLVPYTSYKIYARACINDRNCSVYEIIVESTSESREYDRVELKPLTREYNTSRFQIQFDEPKNVNGAIVSYMTELHKVENGKPSVLLHCITRSEHEKNGYKYYIDNLETGSYWFRVRAVSLAANGEFTNYHVFQIIRPKDSEVSNGVYVISAFLVCLFIAIISFAFYNKHKILIWVRKQNDSENLLGNEAPTDNVEIHFPKESNEEPIVTLLLGRPTNHQENLLGNEAPTDNDQVHFLKEPNEEPIVKLPLRRPMVPLPNEEPIVNNQEALPLIGSEALAREEEEYNSVD